MNIQHGAVCWFNSGENYDMGDNTVSGHKSFAVYNTLRYPLLRPGTDLSDNTTISRRRRRGKKTKIGMEAAQRETKKMNAAHNRKYLESFTAPSGQGRHRITTGRLTPLCVLLKAILAKE